MASYALEGVNGGVWTLRQYMEKITTLITDEFSMNTWIIADHSEYPPIGVMTFEGIVLIP